MPLAGNTTNDFTKLKHSVHQARAILEIKLIYRITRHGSLPRNSSVPGVRLKLQTSRALPDPQVSMDQLEASGEPDRHLCQDNQNFWDTYYTLTLKSPALTQQRVKQNVP